RPGRQTDALLQREDSLVGVLALSRDRLGVHLDAPLREVEDEVERDLGGGVDALLRRPIPPQRRVRHLDDAQHVRWARMAAAIVLDLATDDCGVGFGLVVIRNRYGLLKLDVAAEPLQLLR